MRQAKDNQFVEYPLNEDGTPTGEELHSTNGFKECDSYVDTVQYARPIRDTIFADRVSFGLHIFSPFNFESTVVNGVYEFTTDASGTLEPIQWWDPTEAAGKYIKPGEYAVSEIIPPPNYEPTTEVQQIKLELDANGDPIPAGPLVFKNLAKVGLRVVKYDRLSHQPMNGVTFEIFRNGTSIGRYETKRNGEIVLTGIEPGTYRAVEVDTGDEGHIMDGSYQEIELAAGGGTKDLSGAAIGPDDGVYYTDKAGEIVLEGIEPGTTVIAREIKTVEGYVLDGTPQDILIKAGSVQQLTFWNKKAGTLVIQKKDSVSGTLIAGAQFQLTYANGGYVDNDNGHLSSNGLYKPLPAGDGPECLWGHSGRLSGIRLRPVRSGGTGQIGAGSPGCAGRPLRPEAAPAP